MSSTFWQDRPTFVTGATGQLGSWLVGRLVAAGADVVCLVRDWIPQSELVRSNSLDRVNVVRGDVRDEALLERALAEYEIATVMHLAAQSIVGVANRAPATTFDSNVRGTWTLLEAARRTPTVKQVVLASTDKAYGEHATLPYTEAMSIQASYPHDVSKACADLIAQSYATTFGLATGILRLPNIFGGGDLNWNRIVPGTIRSVLRGRPPVINSDGRFRRDYLYVEDAAAAHMLLAERLAEDPALVGQVFNISNEVNLSVIELVMRILALLESDLTPIVNDKAKNEIRDQYMSSVKARECLGWKPLFTLDDGLVRTIHWYQAFLDGKTKEMGSLAQTP